MDGLMVLQYEATSCGHNNCMGFYWEAELCNYHPSHIGCFGHSHLALVNVPICLLLLNQIVGPSSSVLSLTPGSGSCQRLSYSLHITFDLRLFKMGDAGDEIWDLVQAPNVLHLWATAWPHSPIHPAPRNVAGNIGAPAVNIAMGKWREMDQISLVVGITGVENCCHVGSREWPLIRKFAFQTSCEIG